MIGMLFAMAIGAETAPPPECVQTPSACRYVESFSATFDGVTHEVEVDATLPWVTEGALMLFPGEAVTVKLGPDGEISVESVEVADALVSDESATAAAGNITDAGQAGLDGVLMSGLPRLDAPDDRLRIVFRQPPNSDHSLLIIGNGSEARIDYQAYMNHPDSDEFEYTTTCEILPGLQAHEHWPHPILALILEDFRVAPTPPGAEVDRAIVCD